MSKHCTSQAFQELGIDVTSGLDSAEMSKTLEEIATLNSLFEGKKDLTPDEMALLDSTIRGTIMDKVEQGIKLRELKIQLRTGNPSAKRYRERVINMFIGEGSSIINMGRAITDKLRGRLYKDMSDEARSLINLTSRGSKKGKEASDTVRRGMAELAHGGKLEDVANIPKNMYKEIKEIYSSTIEMQKRSWFEQKNSGIRMGKLDNYMHKQTWNAESVSNFGKPEWSARMEADVDINKVFAAEKYRGKGAEAVALRKEAYDEIYEKIVSKQQGLTAEEGDPVAAILKGKSSSRKLFFKNGEAEFGIFKEFSIEQSIGKILDADMISSGKLVALRNTLGANPRTMVNDLTKDVTKGLPPGKARDRHVAKITENARHLLERPIYEQGNLSSMGKILKAAQMLKLAATPIRQVPMDISSTVRTQMVQKGTINAFSEMATSMSAWMKNVTHNLSNKDIMESMGMFGDQGFGSGMTRLSVGDTAGTGMAAAAQDFASGFTKWTGLDLFTDINRATNANMVANNLDDAFVSFGEGFKNTPNSTQKAFMNLLSTEGRLSPLDIQLVSRNMDKLRGSGDVSYMQKQFNPDKITSLSDDLIRPELKSLRKELSGLKEGTDAYTAKKKQIGTATTMAKRKKTELHSKVKGLMLSKIDSGVPVPNLRYSIKNIVNKGSHVSSAQQLTSSLGMFKDTILNLTARTMEDTRIHYESVGASGVAISSATLAAGAITYYMGIDILSSAYLNKEPVINKIMRDDYKGAAADIGNRISLVPMFTDIFLKIFTRQSPLSAGFIAETVIGPVGGMVDDAIGAATGDKKVKNLAKFATKNLNPLNNWVIDGAVRWAGYDMRNLDKVKKKSEFRLDGR